MVSPNFLLSRHNQSSAVDPDHDDDNTENFTPYNYQALAVLTPSPSSLLLSVNKEVFFCFLKGKAKARQSHIFNFERIHYRSISISSGDGSGGYVCNLSAYIHHNIISVIKRMHLCMLMLCFNITHLVVFCGGSRMHTVFSLYAQPFPIYSTCC